jgi:hypothetical protein
MRGVYRIAYTTTACGSTACPCVCTATSALHGVERLAMGRHQQRGPVAGSFPAGTGRCVRNGSASSTCFTKGGFMESVLLDAAGHRRPPATMPGYHRGRPPRNNGGYYPADPPTVDEIVAVMRAIGDRADGHRLRALIVLLWRAGRDPASARTRQPRHHQHLPGRVSTAARSSAPCIDGRHRQFRPAPVSR